jgi:hypothetical protein
VYIHIHRQDLEVVSNRSSYYGLRFLIKSWLISSFLNLFDMKAKLFPISLQLCQDYYIPKNVFRLTFLCLNQVATLVYSQIRVKDFSQFKCIAFISFASLVRVNFAFPGKLNLITDVTAKLVFINKVKPISRPKNFSTDFLKYFPSIFRLFLYKFNISFEFQSIFY